LYNIAICVKGTFRLDLISSDVVIVLTIFEPSIYPPLTACILASNIPLNFEVRHPRCVSNKSNCKVYAYIVRHHCVFGGMLFTIRRAQLHVSATNFGHHKVVQ